ncbi:hypothetical protein BH09ACT8_BH09ACT8_59610 [soil metagenome]
MPELGNDKVYIHEFITITKQNRARYMHHMTANWSPIAQEERNQLCYGVWGTVGSTGAWPQVVNIWEEDGFAGLARNFGYETGGAGMQDPALAKWWAAAADLRAGGFDRILIPHPETKTIEQLCVVGAPSVTYAHELIRLDKGRPTAFLDSVVSAAPAAHSRLGWQLFGAWHTAMGADDECLLLWAIPTWEAWSDAEQALLNSPDLLLGGAEEQVRGRHRVLLVDAPLSPLRTGRQPARSDRTDWQD